MKVFTAPQEEEKQTYFSTMKQCISLCTPFLQENLQIMITSLQMALRRNSPTRPPLTPAPTPWRKFPEAMLAAGEARASSAAAEGERVRVLAPDLDCLFRGFPLPTGEECADLKACLFGLKMMSSFPSKQVYFSV